MNDDLARIRYVTENYDQLQGLRSLLWGILFLLFAAGTAGWKYFIPAKTGYLELIVILAGLGLYWWIGVYYTRRFGRVERATSRFWQNVIFFGIAFIAIYLDGVTSLPVNLLGLAIAGWFIWMYIEWRGRLHYLIIGSAFALLNLIPVFSSSALTSWDNGYTAFYAFLGLGMIIGGLLDHRLLTQTLPPLPEEPFE